MGAGAIDQNDTQNDLKARLLAALGQGPVTTESLAAYDELHIGGRAATKHLAGALALRAGMRVLDAGSGLGGAARYLAEHYGVHVTGIDLDETYCILAALLSEKTGLEGATEFYAGNALDLPYPDSSFDAAYTIHTAMNIADKAGFYRGIHRVLKPGAGFALYDVLAGTNREPLAYPLPWSARGEDSFLLTAEELGSILEAAGFDITLREDRTSFAKAALERAIRTGKTGAIGLTGGAEAGLRIANLSMAIDDSRCAVWQFSCRRRQA